MSWFPFNYRDVKAWNEDGLPLTTASNEAAKLLDSVTAQLVLHNDDPVFGNAETTIAKMMDADPDFVMGKTLALSLQLLGESPRMKPKLMYDVNNFVDKAERQNISGWYVLLFTHYEMWDFRTYIKVRRSKKSAIRFLKNM
jgi:hypothetical protein